MVIKMRDDMDSARDVEKCWDLEYILKAEPIEFPSGLGMGYYRRT